MLLIISCVVANAVSRPLVIVKTWARYYVGCVVDEDALRQKVLRSSPLIIIPAVLYTNYSSIIYAVRS
jgi:hypothetical protein